MVARFTGASLGLLAFAIAAIGGLYAQNPPFVILSRSIFALFLFCLLGLLLGAAAQMVIDEHADKSEQRIKDRFREDPQDEASPDDDAASGDGENEPVVA